MTNPCSMEELLAGYGPRSAARSRPAAEGTFTIGAVLVDLTAYGQAGPANGEAGPERAVTHADGVAAAGDPAARPGPAGDFGQAA